MPMRVMVAGDIMPDETEKPVCLACGGGEHLKMRSPWHSAPICEPCFCIWYDSGETSAAKIGEESRRLKAEGSYPWTGQYAPEERKT